MVDFVHAYLTFARNLINDGVELESISQLESFQTFRKQNLINFGEAVEVDLELFGYHGDYWTSAFNFPLEGQDVYRVIGDEKTYLGKAINVCLLTFDIDYQ